MNPLPEFNDLQGFYILSMLFNFQGPLPNYRSSVTFIIAELLLFVKSFFWSFFKSFSLTISFAYVCRLFWQPWYCIISCRLLSRGFLDFVLCCFQLFPIFSALSRDSFAIIPPFSAFVNSFFRKICIVLLFYLYCFLVHNILYLLFISGTNLWILSFQIQRLF